MHCQPGAHTLLHIWCSPTHTSTHVDKLVLAPHLHPCVCVRMYCCRLALSEKCQTRSRTPCEMQHNLRLHMPRDAPSHIHSDAQGLTCLHGCMPAHHQSGVTLTHTPSCTQLHAHKWHTWAMHTWARTGCSAFPPGCGWYDTLSPSLTPGSGRWSSPGTALIRVTSSC